MTLTSNHLAMKRLLEDANMCFSYRTLCPEAQSRFLKPVNVALSFSASQKALRHSPAKGASLLRNNSFETSFSETRLLT